MRGITIPGFVLFITAVLNSSNLFAQDNLSRQYDYALSLYNNERYYDAITEFKRLLFFDSSGRYRYSANEYIGLSYKMGAKFSDAVLYCTLAEMNAYSNEEIFNSKIEIIRINILRRTTPRAIALLDSMQNDKRFASKERDIHYWRGWSMTFSDKWDEAAEEFSKTDSNKFLSEFCAKVDREKYSEKFAGIISHFIPGSGQIYTGHYLSGFLSLGWNALWGYLTVKAFIDDRVFDGLVVGNLLWLRFYTGNLQNAENFAKEENLKITNKALDFLQFNYQGIKP